MTNKSSQFIPPQMIIVTWRTVLYTAWRRGYECEAQHNVDNHQLSLIIKKVQNGTGTSNVPFIL